MTFLDTLVLTRGSHGELSGEYCAMEAVARLASERHSDAPECACPVITRYVQRINDARWSSDLARTDALRPWIEQIARSRRDQAEETARVEWLAHRALTWWAPLAGMSSVQCLEEYGYDCTQMREAYFALLESPSVMSATKAKDAASAYRAYVAADVADAAVYVADIAARTQTDALRSHAGVYRRHAASRAADAAIYAASYAASAAGRDAQDFYLRAAVEDLEELLSIQ